MSTHSEASGRPDVSVVVPVYNGSATLGELVERTAAALAARGSSFEVVLVNDGSRDESWEVIRRLSQRPGVRGLDLSRNYGQHNALLCGIRAARAPVIVTIDDDLQNPPEEIPTLLDRLDERTDVVYGSPAAERHGLWRDVASQVTKLALQQALGAQTARQVSAFRVFKRHVARAFEDYRGTHVSIDVLLTWGTTRFASCSVRHDPRRAGRSNYTFRKLLVHSLNMVTGFSTLPLQAASLVGFATTIFGVGVLAFVLGRYVLQGVSVPGFTFLASIITVFAGAQLFAIGVIGEYLARMHFRMLERPSYVVRATAGQDG
jgi:undecaprenyl-phosphate 4-deoxy-4-formamido-L-arabinose transferase